jgi:hypothetical protein
VSALPEGILPTRTPNPPHSHSHRRETSRLHPPRVRLPLPPLSVPSQSTHQNDGKRIRAFLLRRLRRRKRSFEELRLFSLTFTGTASSSYTASTLLTFLPSLFPPPTTTLIATTVFKNRCEKRFSRSDELTRHVRIHSSERGRKKTAQQQAQAQAAAVATAMNGGVAPPPSTGKKAKGRESRQNSPGDEVRFPLFPSLLSFVRVSAVVRTDGVRRVLAFEPFVLTFDLTSFSSLFLPTRRLTLLPPLHSLKPTLVRVRMEHR